MMTLIVNTKKKKEEALLKEFLNKQKMGFHSEVEEEQALYNAMLEGRKTALLNQKEKEEFLKKIKK